MKYIYKFYFYYIKTIDLQKLKSFSNYVACNCSSNNNNNYCLLIVKIANLITIK